MPRITRPAPPSKLPASQKTWTRPKHGEWTTNSSGKRSDPVNLYVHGSLDQLKAAFARSGWSVADPKTVPNALKYAGAAVGDVFIEKPAQAVAKGLVGAWDAITGRHDQPSLPNPFQGTLDKMPVSDQTFLGKKELLAFEKQNDPLGGRHHFRVWDTGQKDAQGRPVWAIAATRDIGVRYDLTKPQDYFTQHLIQKDADLERDAVLQSLQSAGAVAKSSKLPLKFGQRADGAFATGAYDVVLK